MKQIRYLGMAVMAVLALTAIATAATASAAATLPSILPENLPSKSKSGKSLFGSGATKITSQKSVGTDLPTTVKLGTFDVLFEESKDALGDKCTGLNDTKESESILVLGTYHFRDWKKGSELRVADIFLLKPVHFECPNEKKLFVVQGCVAGDVTPVNLLTKTVTATLTKQTGNNANDNEIITVLNDENTANELCELKVAGNEGALELSSEQTTQEITFTSGGKPAEVLVMPL
jgi:hypothetical protein